MIDLVDIKDWQGLKMVSFNLLGKKWTFDQDSVKYLAIGLGIFYVLRIIKYFVSDRKSPALTGKATAEKSETADSGSGNVQEDEKKEVDAKDQSKKTNWMFIDCKCFNVFKYYIAVTIWNLTWLFII